MADEPQAQPKGDGKAYWRANLRLIIILLSVWFVVSYLCAIFLANVLYEVPFFQINLAFWFAQQGSMIVFVCLIFIYAKMMDKIDRDYDVHE
jgi:putative solute:sodium symporter small subunit